MQDKHTSRVKLKICGVIFIVITFVAFGDDDEEASIWNLSEPTGTKLALPYVMVMFKGKR